MIKIDPQQEIFTQIILDLKQKGYAVFDTILPPEDTPYPFIYLGDNQQQDTDTKNAIYGKVFQTIHIWHNDPNQRGTVSSMLLDIKTTCRKIAKTANFSWSCKITSQRILPDNTTKTPLLHGIVEAEFNFS